MAIANIFHVQDFSFVSLFVTRMHPFHTSLLILIFICQPILSSLFHSIFHQIFLVPVELSWTGSSTFLVQGLNTYALAKGCDNHKIKAVLMAAFFSQTIEYLFITIGVASDTGFLAESTYLLEFHCHDSKKG